MDKIDAVEVLKELRPLGRKSMGAKILATRVNVMRPTPHTKSEFADLVEQMKGQGMVRTKKDAFGELLVSITDEGENLLAEAGL